MKKNKKQRFISDKISELRAEGKNQQESITIALNMAQNYLQQGGYQVETDLEGYGLNTTPIVAGDLNNVEQYQKYTGKGYGNKVQDANKTINTHSWYFTDEEKKKRFLEASSKKGGSQDVRDFQEAYNKELKNRLNSSGLDEQQKNKIYGESAFTGKGVQSIDGKFGAFTSSRPMFEPTQQTLSPQLTPAFSQTPSVETQTINKPKLYKVKIHAEDMSDGNRDHQQGNLNAYIQDRTEKQGGLTEEDLEYVKKGLELSNKDIEGKYNNKESKNNPKAQERYKKLKQSLIIEEFKYGGDVELPKYQKGVNFVAPVGYNANPNTSPFTTYTGQNNYFDFPNSYKNNQLSIGQLDLNSNFGQQVTNNKATVTPISTQNTTVATTTTEKPTTEEKTLTPQTVTSTNNGGASFYKGMFSQPGYTPPNDLGFTPKTQFGTSNYVSPFSEESLTAGEDFVKNNPLPKNIIPTELNLETPLMDKYSKENVVKTPKFERQTPPIQFANPYGGVDLNAASALFGQSLQQGDAAMGIASGAKLGLGLARNFMSGYAAQKDRNRVLNDYSSNMRNAMTGVETPNQLYQEGGTANEQEQLLQQVAMMLQQGLPPEQIMQELVNMGMPEQEAMQVVQMVMQQAQAPQEQQMMQEGGVATQPEVPVEMANAEIEDGEYVQDGEGVKYAEGAKHSEGGIPTQLENGARVLSDYKKVGKDLAKQFSEQLGFEVKASDTFATVLDKFNRKEGFDKKVKHLDEYSDKLEKQEKTVKHDATLALNKQILMEEAQEDTQKLQELVKQQEGLFNMLFEAQEASKGIKTEGNFMQQGGTVNDLMAKYNISAEEAMKLVPSMQDAGTFSIDKFGNRTDFQNLTDAATLGKMYGEARKYTPEEKKVIYDYYSTGVKDKASLDKIKNDLDNDRLIFNQSLLNDLQTNKDIPLQYQVETINGLHGTQTPSKVGDYRYADDFKRIIGRPFTGSVEDSKLWYSKVIPALKEEGVIYDASPTTGKGTELFGNRYAGMPEFVKEMSANKEYSLDAELYKKATPEEREAIARSLGVDKNTLDQEASKITTGFINFKPQGETAPSTVAETPMEIPTTPVVDVAQDKNRMAFLNLPDQTPMLPWAMQAPAMLRQTIYAPRWNEISPEQQLTDIQRGRVATAEQMSFLPDSQQASSLFALDANAMAAQNKVRTETERYNQMARERTEAAEADQKTRQSAADVVAAQTYQQQLGNELEYNEADWRSWHNRVQSNQMNNFLTVKENNRSNWLNGNIQFNGQGYEVINEPTFTNDASKKYIAEQEKKTKKKNPVAKDGGTFRGKKPTKRFGK